MKRILIADDIEENLYLLRSLLEGHGYTVDKASNGSEALVKALAVPPDLIITDILMPVIDGFTLCRIWKADKSLSRIPFIFYTATYTDPRDEELAIDMGADAFIIKPTEPDEFLRVMERVLNAERDITSMAPRRPKVGEETILKNYNETLIRKLEHKMLNLEKVNKDLEAEMAARTEAEKSKRESEQRYRTLFENSMVGVLLTKPDGAILSANPEACRILGRSEEELRRTGRNALVDMDDLALKVALEKRAKTGRFTGEIMLKRSDGSLFPCEISSALFRDSEGNLMTSMVIQDITERKRNEERIIAALQEKNILLKEVHHRVKNNMQVISSMISLQLGGGLADVSMEKIAAISVDIQNRIRSLALVHEILYSSKNLSKIDFKEYLDNLASSITNTLQGGAGRVSVTVETGAVFFDITTAVPLGLIVNELLTNSLKHAFPSGRKGEIHVVLSADTPDLCELIVRDNGIGLPEDFDVMKSESFGMRLVGILIEQLRASIEVRGAKGTEYTIRFKNGHDDMAGSPA